jgi:hypothetical protein
MSDNLNDRMNDIERLPLIAMPGERAYPPRLSTFTQPFWDGLREGRWQTSGCQTCGRQTFPPKPVCPHCWSTDVAWGPLSPHGTLYSWTRIHAAPTVFAPEAPYAVGIVDLSTGIRLACRLIEVAGLPFTPDMPVNMAVLQYEDGPLFAARPVPPASLASAPS